MTVATKPSRKSSSGSPSRGSTSTLAKRLADLRYRAVNDPGAARDEAWDWSRQLGADLRSDRETASAALAELFAAGKASVGIDGPTEGTLVGWAAQPKADRVLSAITALWLPWVGKRFNAAAGTGDNLMLGPVRYIGRLVWPFYGFRDAEGRTAGFNFTTRVEPGKLDPGTDVLVIDYESVLSNPRLAIRSVRDELVEIVPGTHLGKMLWRSGRGENARYTLLAYFALRSSLD